MKSASTDTNQRKSLELRGLYPATLTPFNPDLSVDWGALRSHLAAMTSVRGVQGIVVNGGLGELLQLSLDEQLRIVSEAVELRRPGQIVITGLSSPNMRQGIDDAKALRAAGADALLVLPPFDVRAYRRLIAHTPAVLNYFRSLGEGGGLPMIVFQYGPQSGCAYSVETMRALAEQVPEVVGMKATSGSLDAYRPFWDSLKDKISVLAAVDGPPLVDMLEYGAHGALVGISTIGTHLWVDLVDAAAKADRERLRKIFRERCAPIMEHVWENHLPTRMSSEVAATKEALVQLGQLPSSRVRPPAIDVDDTTRAAIRRGLDEAGLLREAVAA
jgi:4-hydroxy-tetrahydrodipicolinate synthase